MYMNEIPTEANLNSTYAPTGLPLNLGNVYICLYLVGNKQSENQTTKYRFPVSYTYFSIAFVTLDTLDIIKLSHEFTIGSL